MKRLGQIDPSRGAPRSRRLRALGGGLAGAALVAGAFALVPAHADPVASGNLVVNGGAEDGTTGWTGGLGTAVHDSGGYPGSVIVDAGGATGETFDGGDRLFTGSGGSSTAFQTVDVSAYGDAIDAGSIEATIGAHVGGYANQADNATVTFAFLDGLSAELESISYGPVTNVDRGNTSGFVAFSGTLAPPPGTRAVLVTIDTQRFIAPANDGYVDNVVLELVHEGPAVTVNGPTDGATYEVGDEIPADFGCATAPGVEVDTLEGTEAQGAPIDTSAPGTYTFEVTCTDEHGGTSTVSVTYTVVEAPPAPACAEDGLALLNEPGVDIDRTYVLLSGGIHKGTEDFTRQVVDPLTIPLLGLNATDLVHQINCDLVEPLEDVVDSITVPLIQNLGLQGIFKGLF